jgi:hypothetical protein
MPARLAPARRLAVAALAALALGGLGAAIAFAQTVWQPDWQMRSRWFRTPPRFPDADTFDGTYNYCRVMYDSVRREAGGQGWWTDYPTSDMNLSIRLSELTKTPISQDLAGMPRHVVVRFTDDALFRCPLAMIEDAGTAGLSDAEVEGLRAYLLKGGFLWVDDFWGTRAWEAWLAQLERALPRGEYSIVDLPGDHPVFRTLYEVAKLPQIPSIQFWRESGGATSERGPDSDEPHARAAVDADGRVMVLMTHNTDIADAWEREGEDREFFYTFSVDGYAVGINVVLYAMSH